MRPDGSGLESIVGGGYDNGIEIVFNAAGEMFGRTIAIPSSGSALLHSVEGGIYPNFGPVVNQYKCTEDLMHA